LAKRALRQGMDLRKLIRHYSPPDVREAHTHGLTPSVLCGKGALERLVETHSMAKNGFSSKRTTWTTREGQALFSGPKPSQNEHSNSSPLALMRR